MRWLIKLLDWIWGDPIDPRKITAEAMRVLKREALSQGLIRQTVEGETLIQRLEAEKEHRKRWIA